MAVALTALVFAMTGAGYAATHLGGSAPAKVAKKKKVKRGPPGPQGPAGPAGPAGATTSGPAGPSATFGVINNIVGTASNIAAPVGITTTAVNNIGSAEAMLTPSTPIVIRDLAASLPGVGISNTGTYTIEFIVGTSTAPDVSCTIAAAPAGNGHSCNSGNGALTVPAGSQLAIDAIPGGTAVPASGTLEFGYRTATP